MPITLATKFTSCSGEKARRTGESITSRDASRTQAVNMRIHVTEPGQC
jgi:hypothetical protein